jgi:Fibronectin type III domain
MTTMNVPGIGSVNSKWVWGGAAVTAGIVGYAYWRQNKAAADVPVDPNADQSSTDYNVDQGTGYGTVYGTDPYGDGYTDGYPTSGYYPYPYATSPTPPPPVSDQDWNSRVVEYLQELGTDGTTASLAISKYQLRECLTAQQADIVRQAIGRFGSPPQSTDLRIIQCPASPAPTGGTNVPGKVGGLHATNVTTNSIRISWSAVSGVSGYRIQSVGASGWQTIGTTSSTSFTRSGLKHGTRYSFRVIAYNLAGNGPAASISVATHR